MTLQDLPAEPGVTPDRGGMTVFWGSRLSHRRGR
jgi:hypothetical protein